MMVNASPMAVANTTPASRRKKYVTRHADMARRACDACKKRKSKCDGSEPCSRCVNSDIDLTHRHVVCAYKSSYNRIQRRSQAHVSSSRRPNKNGRRPLGDEIGEPSPVQPRVDSEDAEPVDHATPMRLDDEEGDASVHTFLRRVSGHLASVGQGLPRYLFKREEEILASDDSDSTFILPSEEVARSYIDCFFEHSNVTYRYLHRGRTTDLLSRVYKQEEAVLRSNTKMARILLAMGLGCIWVASWRNEPLVDYKAKAYGAIPVLRYRQLLTVIRLRLLRVGQMRLEKAYAKFPPTIGILQAHILKCQLELASNRYNAAWMTLGIAVRLGQMIDIQKDQPLADPVDEFCRRGVFWALFMIDRYLSVSLGRPMAMHTEDLTTQLPSVVVHSRIGAEEAKLAEGVKAHARLTMIVGQAISKLYPGVRTSTEARDQVVASLEDQLTAWLRDTPSFFHPQDDEADPVNDGFYNVPWVFRRQRRTVRAAYYFTNMLIYRGHLLMEFLDQAPSTPLSKSPSPEIRKCVDSALSMAKMAGLIAEDCSYNAVYWTTTHFTFCAISILLVYLTLYRECDDRSDIESVVEKAMEGHKKLNHTTDHAQRLLEESRTRAQQVHSANAPSTGAAQDTPVSENRGAEPRVEPHVQVPIQPDFSGDGLDQLDGTWEETLQGPSNDMIDNLSLDMDPFGGSNGFGMIMDIGFDNVAMPIGGGADLYPF